MPLVQTYKETPSEIIKLKYDNYKTALNDKTYDQVLKSFIAWAITLKCRNLRCDGQLKLSCFCDINNFQYYTYHVIMGLIELKANNNGSLLTFLCNPRYETAEIVNKVLSVLSGELGENTYFKTYKKFITEWINFEFYNFQCDYCQHINKTIMIDRVYEYSKTMDSCRICNKKQIARIQNNEPQFDINTCIENKNKPKEKPYEPRTEFTLYSLNEYLTKCGVDEEDIDTLEAYLREEEYDSDALMEDIMDEQEKDSNIFAFIVKNIKSRKNYNCYYLVQKYLNYDRYPVYTPGVLIRYLVLRPKYFSLLKELCLNDVHKISFTQDWQNKILSQVLKEHKK